MRDLGRILFFLHIILNLNCSLAAANLVSWSQNIWHRSFHEIDWREYTARTVLILDRSCWYGQWSCLVSITNCNWYLLSIIIYTSIIKQQGLTFVFRYQEVSALNSIIFNFVWNWVHFLGHPVYLVGHLSGDILQKSMKIFHTKPSFELHSER